MSFFDLEYGQDNVSFTLKDASIERTVTIDEGKVTVRRWLHAKAVVPIDMYSEIYIGVPESKQHKVANNLPRVREILLEIHEDDSDKPRPGRYGYRDVSEYSDEHAFAFLHVSPAIFDQIEEICGRSTARARVTLLLEGWKFLGPIGDSAFYIDTDKKDSKADLWQVQSSQGLVTDGTESEPLDLNNDGAIEHPEPDTAQVAAKAKENSGCLSALGTVLVICFWVTVVGLIASRFL